MGVDIDGAATDLAVEISQRIGEGVLHDRGQSIEFFAVKTLLNKTPLCDTRFPVGSEKAFTQEVAHPFYLDFGFLIILRIGLQHMLNDGGIGSHDGLFKATDIKPERVAEIF